MTALGSSTPRSTTTNKTSSANAFSPTNGLCYKSQLWHRACNETRTTVKKTRPADTDPKGTEAYDGFVHFTAPTA
jgi:hypothetical protein